jgi:hypothetical protein
MQSTNESSPPRKQAIENGASVIFGVEASKLIKDILPTWAKSYGQSFSLTEKEIENRIKKDFIENNIQLDSIGTNDQILEMRMEKTEFTRWLNCTPNLDLSEFWYEGFFERYKPIEQA